ncbi:hypothetical protein GALMADRAFT_142447 [Galerina marginata CBS 339.88]|uniref:Galactose oxidase-like Early set domain-containing protein n=1 Tax=Galerina marginata (strain CBS 339.88) TaxID=685588 RepID=A0A067SQV9_GALM3|nr:hypothetical protein GALMADRAFT_142447 [Galerina marginata CBS 339.88]
MRGPIFLSPVLALVGVAFAAAPRWEFVQNGTTGVLALEAIVVSPTLAIFFNRASNDPLMINGHSAWGALWNFETNTASPLNLITDSFCGSGGFLSNGTMVSLGGNIPLAITPALDGRMGIRIFEPCDEPNGVGCAIVENPTTLHLAETRWYTSSIRISDGSLMIVGGIHESSPFYNTDPVNSFEFFPPKDGGVPRQSAFLERTLPANLFPRVFALPDGTVLMIANNQTIIYDIEKNTETILPEIPNGVRVSNPFDGTATLLPLSPPDFIPEVLVCGGSTANDQTPSAQLSSQDPASDQCSRLTLTPAGIKKGWQVEHLLEGRIMPEMILLPNGQVLITNGAGTGYPAINSVANAINAASNADHPVFTPSLYTPDAPLGKRISNDGLPTTNIPRLYHSSATLTPSGNIMIAGSNPNTLVDNTTTFHTEFRVEFLNPPFMSGARPQLIKVPPKMAFNDQFQIEVSIPKNLKASSVQLAFMDLGFSSHAFHSSQRLVFADTKLSADRKTLTVRSPPNNRVFPPGPAFLFLTIDGVTSAGTRILLGNGLPPPVRDQGIRI